MLRGRGRGAGTELIVNYLFFSLAAAYKRLPFDPTMTCRLALALCCLLAARASAAAPAEARVHLDCAGLMRELQRFLAIRTDMDVLFSAETCMLSSLMRMFLRETSALLAVESETALGMDVVVREDDPALAQILVLALIGRHYTAEFQTGQAFFEFDPATQILTPHMLRCEYQWSFLVLLLFVSIVLMVFSLVMQNLNTLELARIAALEDAPLLDPKAGIVKTTALQHISIDFAHQRRFPETVYNRL